MILLPKIFGKKMNLSPLIINIIIFIIKNIKKNSLGTKYRFITKKTFDYKIELSSGMISMYRQN